MFQDGMNKQGKRKRKTVTIKAKIRAINRNVDYDIIDRTVRPIKQYGEKTCVSDYVRNQLQGKSGFKSYNHM